MFDIVFTTSNTPEGKDKLLRMYEKIAESVGNTEMIAADGNAILSMEYDRTKFHISLGQQTKEHNSRIEIDVRNYFI